ncbi:MAG: Ig-like domain-containing protein [Bacilli bacterium]|nr:Ig-like domain-containing protein [Bacilli bacterium]
MKHNKLFAMLAVAAALAVSACSGNGDNPSSSAHKHSAAPDAPWKYDNNNHWKDCAANDGGKAENARHTFGDPTDVVPATCTATGSQKVKCTVCGAEVTQTLAKKDHTWGEWEVTQAATCTEAGSRKHVCSVCQTEESETIQATGHTWGEWEITKEAKCGVAGSRKHKCSVCGVEESEVIEALEHDLELVGGETPAPTGEATVRLYRCKLCGETSLGFAANEPSEASKPHLMEGANGGMRFFGRPIGNALALKADGGSEHETNNECVYCSTETGDFFEYVFTLNADQAATLANARLYCDARPANYLSGDFWAYNRSADDWTPGYYIDGADDHVQKDATTGEVVMVKDHAKATKNEDGSWTEGVELETEVKMGARIEDYRYILYVDGNPVDFDAETSVPVKGSQNNMQRAEYVLPYTFHLHEGKNTISLRMAGGYRSEFYNFIFRPYVAPTPVVVNETNLEMREGKTAQITSSMEGLTYASANNRIATVDANGLVTGVKAGETTITVSKEGNYKDAKVPVTVLEKEGVISLNLEDGVIAPADGAEKYTSGSSGTWYRNFKKDATVTYTFTSELAGEFDLTLGLRASSDIVLADNFEIKVNDAAVAVTGTVPNTNYSARDFIVGQANLVEGNNTLVIKALADNGLFLKTLKLAPHAHAWGDKQEVAASGNGVAYDKYVCNTCGASKFEVKLDDSMLASGSVNKNDPAGYMKLKANGQSFSFKINVEAVATGKIYQRGVMDSWSSNKNRNVFSGGSQGADDFELTVNGTKVDISAYKSAKWSDVMKGEAQSGNLSPLTDVESGLINLVAGENTITYTRKASYNLALTHIVFIVK